MTRLVLIAGIWLLGGCSQPATPPAAPTISVDSVAGDVANITIDTGTGKRSGAVVGRGLAGLVDLGNRLRAGKLVAGPVSAVNVTVLGPAGADQTIGRKILHASFPADRLAQAAATGNADSVVDAATELSWWTPSNDDVVNDYCTAKPTAALCRKTN